MPDNNQTNTQAIAMQNIDISFGVRAIKWMTENQNFSFDKIIALYDKKAQDGSMINIYDKENQIIVSMKKINDMYIIDSIISDVEEVK